MKNIDKIIELVLWFCADICALYLLYLTVIKDFTILITRR